MYEKPDSRTERTGWKVPGEVVRVVDFNGAWCRLAPETVQHLEEDWEAWMLTEEEDETLLEEISDQDEAERLFTRELFRRIWKIHDHVLARLRDDSDRACEYLPLGRVPP